MANWIEQLRNIPGLLMVPEDQLQWLVDEGEILHLKEGEFLFRPDEPADYLQIIFEGRIRTYISQQGQNQELIVMEPGTITGLLPYSRMKQNRANGVVVKPAVVLRFHRSKFPALIKTRYELTEALVHEMTNRVRSFTALQQQNEKLMALGKLSAGLAHELNNPAAAVVRSAQELKAHLGYQPEKFKKVIKMRLDDAVVDQVNETLFARLAKVEQPHLSLMEKTEREDDLMDWLEDQEIKDADEIASTLVEFGFAEDDLEEVLDRVGEDAFGPVIAWMNNVLATEKLVQEIKDASTRIADLVGSIKSYTHMDRDQDKQLVDLHDGIRITANILKHKFRQNGVQLIESFGPEVPKVPGYPSSLNQVWTNLIDNALDALAGQKDGKIEVSSCRLGSTVVVQVIDNGPGIPEEDQSLIFDPFFTTKELGKGTGMGLDVVHKIVQRHRARIAVDSAPGRTEFKITFPLD
jgi:signal transduction histidine kinase